MELWGVVVGGALAIMGGYLAEREAAKTRRREADRERLHRYRDEARAAAVEAAGAVRSMDPSYVTLKGSTEEIRQRAWDMEPTLREVTRLLMSVALGPPGSEADALGETAEHLRSALSKSASMTMGLTLGVLGIEEGRNTYEEARGAHDELKAAFDAYKLEVRKLGVVA